MEAEFLYNPVGTGPYCHAPTILMTAKGDMLAAWYAYVEEERQASALVVARRPVGSAWQPARLAGDKFNNSVGNPVLFETSDGDIWLLFVVLRGSDWRHSELMGMSTENVGYSWTRPRMVNPERGMMVRHPPVTVRGDSLMLPAYDEKAKQSVLLMARKEYSQWSEVYRFDALSLIQPVLVRESSGALTALFRPTGHPRVIWRSRSGDEGVKWSTPVRTTLPTSLSGIGAFSLPDRLGVVYNHTNEHQRHPLSIAWSEDAGVSWSEPWHIDSVVHEVSYPSFIAGRDGRVHGVYSYNRRMIKYTSFSPRRIG